MTPGKKTVLKWIEKESEKLPKMYYRVKHKYSRPMLTKNSETDKEEWVLDYEQNHEVNHKRRIWRVYKNHGIQEVHRYFLLYGFVLNEKTH